MLDCHRDGVGSTLVVKTMGALKSRVKHVGRCAGGVHDRSVDAKLARLDLAEYGGSWQIQW